MVDSFEAFVIEPTYTVVEDEQGKHPIVLLYVRLADGRSALVRKSFRPYFFILKTDAKKLEGLKTAIPFEIEVSKLKSLDRQSVVKVFTQVPGDVPKLRELLEKVDVRLFEADVRFAYRAMMDWGIHASFLIKGASRKPLDGELVDVVFEQPNILPVADPRVPALSSLSFDIESDKHSGDIYCISSCIVDVVDKRRYEKFIVSKNPVRGARHFSSEGAMLQAFVDLVRESDPDIVTGWNVIDFDLAHLQVRARKAKVPLALGRDGRVMRMRVESSFFRDSSASITGRLVLDGIQLLRNSFIRLPDYKLATAAEEFTAHKKLIESTGKEKYEEINRLYLEDKESLLEYNLTDATLVCDILKNSGVLELTIKRSLLTGMPLDRVNASIASLDSLYLRELRERGFVADVVGRRGRSDEGMGGFVMQSKPGIYDYVIVCDFKSLYPSIMRTFNIDPLAFVRDPDAKGDFIVAPNGARFRRELGIVPGLIKRFWEEREVARKRGDELTRYAIKIHMNSLYGVFASPNCRFFDRLIGNAITSFAQSFIKLTSKHVEEQGYEVIYGDTDSVFINLNCGSFDVAQRLGKEIEKSMNVFLKKLIEGDYHLESFMELEFEKTFIRFVMPHVRGSDRGAKKRYAGLVRKSDGTQDISFTGLEMVRRDWTDLAKEFQYELYRRVFAKEEVAGYVLEVIKKLKSGVLDDKLVYRKALRKGVDEYTKTTPPHVKAAMKMSSELDSSIIEYVLTTDGPEPVSERAHEIDYEHYIDKQLKPIADSILMFYDTSFDEQLDGSSQKSLFDY